MCACCSLFELLGLHWQLRNVSPAAESDGGTSLSKRTKCPVPLRPATWYDHFLSTDVISDISINTLEMAAPPSTTTHYHVWEWVCACLQCVQSLLKINSWNCCRHCGAFWCVWNIKVCFITRKLIFGSKFSFIFNHICINSGRCCNLSVRYAAGLFILSAAD